MLGWSELGFAQAGIGHQLPVMGVVQHGPAVEPPTTSGHPLTGETRSSSAPRPCASSGSTSASTVHIGDDTDPFTVVGTVTLPSFGIVLTDHVSLGRGAMMEEDTLLSILLGPNSGPVGDNPELNVAAVPVYPSAAVFDVSSHGRRQRADEPDHQLAVGAQPGNAGSLYPLSPQLGAPVSERQPDGQPAPDARDRRGDRRGTGARPHDPGLRPGAAPGPGPAQGPRPAVPPDPGGRRLADHDDPGHRDRSRGAARHRGRELAVDHLRELDRRRAAAGRARHGPGGRASGRCSSAGTCWPSGPRTWRRGSRRPLPSAPSAAAEWPRVRPGSKSSAYQNESCIRMSAPAASSIAASWYAPSPSGPGPRSAGLWSGRYATCMIAIADPVPERPAALVRDFSGHQRQRPSCTTPGSTLELPRPRSSPRVIGKFGGDMPRSSAASAVPIAGAGSSSRTRASSRSAAAKNGSPCT